jgi:hypothetical protein
MVRRALRNSRWLGWRPPSWGFRMWRKGYLRMRQRLIFKTRLGTTWPEPLGCLPVWGPTREVAHCLTWFCLAMESGRGPYSRPTRRQPGTRFLDTSRCGSSPNKWGLSQAYPTLSRTFPNITNESQHIPQALAYHLLQSQHPQNNHHA